MAVESTTLLFGSPAETPEVAWQIHCENCSTSTFGNVAVEAPQKESTLLQLAAVGRLDILGHVDFVGFFEHI